MKMYEFVVPGHGTMIGSAATLGRAQDKYGFARVRVIRSWEI